MQNAAYWTRLRQIALAVATMSVPTSASASEVGAADSEQPAKERQSETGDQSRRLDRAEDMIVLLREGNRVELEGAKLALEKAQAERVKNYARLLATEHQRCDKQLMDYAIEKGIDQRRLQENQQPTDGPLARLRVRQRQNFDRAFILAMVREHGKMIDALTSTMQESRDGDLRHVLAELLPVLKMLKKEGEVILARLPANSEN